MTETKNPWAAMGEEEAIAKCREAGATAHYPLALMSFLGELGMLGAYANADDEVVGRFLQWLEDGKPPVRRPR